MFLPFIMCQMFISCPPVMSFQMDSRGLQFTTRDDLDGETILIRPHFSTGNSQIWGGDGPVIGKE